MFESRLIFKPKPVTAHSTPSSVAWKLISTSELPHRRSGRYRKSIARKGDPAKTCNGQSYSE
jgi:hypothetical protein